MLESALRVLRTSRIPPLKRLLGVGAGLVALTALSMALMAVDNEISGVSILWLPNAMLLGVLLCSPRKQWAGFLLLGFAIDVCFNAVVGRTLSVASSQAFVNLLETTLPAVMLYRTISANPDLTEGKQFRGFLLYAVFLAPAGACLMNALLLLAVDGVPLAASFHSWFAADVLGMSIVTPIYLTYHRRGRFSSRSGLEVTGFFLLLTSVSVWVFRYTQLPMLWLVLLVLLLVSLRLGFTGSAVGLLVVTFIGGVMTARGYGPLSTAVFASMDARILFFQVFVGLSMMALYLRDTVAASRRRLRLRMEASERRFRTLAEASRDVIALVDRDHVRRYFSPSVREVLGWTPAEIEGTSPRDLEMCHPADVSALEAFGRELTAGKEPPALAYRYLKKDGSYLWVEATARMLPSEETGEPEGYVWVLRDITDRKAEEERLRNDLQTVEQLALVDGLTGVANRRRLDETLKREWLVARRERLPVSLLLIDVDHFKRFNDEYGHLAGDECLQRIACEIQTVLRRPPDLLARYGGEEFVAVLPNTPARGAELIAEMVRRVVEACAIPHAGNPHGVVTVSVGYGTHVPRMDSGPNLLLEAADAALYRAKAGGRNQVQAAIEMAVN